MKRPHIFRLLGLTATLTLASTAFAATVWTGPAYVTEVWAGYTSGYVFVRGPSNAANCSSSLIRFDTATSQPERIQQVAVAAFLSGKRLDCVVDTVCVGSYQQGKNCVLRD